MMVWKWYDWMIVVWWFGSCVYDWRIANSCKESSRTFSRFLQTPKYHTKHSLSFRFLQLFHFTSRLENILKTSEDQIETPSAVIWFDVMYPRTYLKTLKSRSVFLFFLYQYYYKKIKRSSGSSVESRTYTNSNQITAEDFVKEGLQRSSGSSGMSVFVHFFSKL